MRPIDFVTDRLATGGDLNSFDDREAVADLERWVEAGITHIIDCRAEWSDEDLVAELAPHVTYLHNGVDDAGGRLPRRFWDRGVAFAQAALADPDAKLVVHCHMGINRGPSMAYAVLLAEGWDHVEAIDAIRRARPIAAVDYAEDALDHHLGRTAAAADQVARHHRQLAEWRAAHPLDVVRIIRGVRAEEREARRRLLARRPASR